MGDYRCFTKIVLWRGGQKKGSKRGQMSQKWGLYLTHILPPFKKLMGDYRWFTKIVLWGGAQKKGSFLALFGPFLALFWGHFQHMF